MFESVLILLWILILIGCIVYFANAMSKQDELYYAYMNKQIQREKELEKRVFLEIKD